MVLYPGEILGDGPPDVAGVDAGGIEAISRLLTLVRVRPVGHQKCFGVRETPRKI